MTKKQNLEEMARVRNERHKDLIKIFGGSAVTNLLLINHQQSFSDFFNKIGLLANDASDLSKAILMVSLCMNLHAGAFAGFTGRYHTSAILYTVCLLPELFNFYNEDLTMNVKRLAAKTAIIYGSWALGKLGKKLYELNTNRDGIDLFNDYKQD